MRLQRMLRIWMAGITPVLLGMTCYAQDTLVLKDGNEIYVKVLEIGDQTLSYKKKDHLDGPAYTIDLSRVFMAIYKGGKRETFEPAAATGSGMVQQTETGRQPQEESKMPVTLSQNGWEARLTSAALVPDKNNDMVSAVAEVWINSKKLLDLTVFVSQKKKNTEFNYASVNKKYYASNSIIISSVAPKRYRDLLFEKYESYTGKGLGWAIPTDFFSPASTTCSVTYLQYKHDVRDVGIATDAVIPERRPMVDCSSVERKILSFVLLWVEENFGKK